MSMTVRKLLRDSDGSFRITLPKDELEAAGIVPEDGDPGETFVKVEGEGREFRVEVLNL